MENFEVMLKWYKKIGIEIFDKQLIPLDHVTYGFLERFAVQFGSVAKIDSFFPYETIVYCNMC